MIAASVLRDQPAKCAHTTLECACDCLPELGCNNELMRGIRVAEEAGEKEGDDCVVFEESLATTARRDDQYKGRQQQGTG